MEKNGSFIGLVKEFSKLDEVESIMLGGSRAVLSEFFASYFDIVFAINELPHPGEKRILEYFKKNGRLIPDQMSTDVQMIMQTAMKGDLIVTKQINDLINRLEELIKLGD